MKGWLVAGACTLAVAVGAAAALGTGDQPTSDAPDTIVHNGRVTTMDGRIVHADGAFKRYGKD